jgi:hypothetical protein
LEALDRQGAARNEALFRRVNERVEEVSSAFAPILDAADFYCECADIDCSEKIQMTLADYEALRSVATHFAVKPGHVRSDAERVVERRPSHVVVEKVGQAGRRAAELDPREPED